MLSERSQSQKTIYPLCEMSRLGKYIDYYLPRAGGGEGKGRWVGKGINSFLR